jgi:hypothetical protein
VTALTAASADWRTRMACSTADLRLFDVTATAGQHAEAEDTCLGCPVFIQCHTETARRAEKGEELTGFIAGDLWIAGTRWNVEDYHRQEAAALDPKRPVDLTPIPDPHNDGHRLCVMPDCRKSFPLRPHGTHKVYCSKDCSQRNRSNRKRPAPVDRTCDAPGCDVRFVVTSARAHRLTCSDRCSRARKNRNEMAIDRTGVRNCQRPDCGRTFTGTRRAKYCPGECRKWAMAENARRNPISKRRWGG